MLSLLFAAILCSPFVCYVILIAWLHRKYSSIPGPPRSSFLFGNLHEIATAIRNEKIISQLFHEWHLRYGYTIKYFIFHKTLIVTCDPQLVKHLLLDHPKTILKGEMYEQIGFAYGDRAMGYGLITVHDYEAWLAQRSILNAAFHRRHFARLISEFNTVADALILKLHQCSGSGTPVNMAAYFSRATMDIIAKVAFGMATDSVNDENNPLATAVCGMLTGLSAALTSAFPRWSPLLYYERKTYRAHLRVLKDTGRKLITERLEAIKREDNIPDDILSTMVKAHAADPSFSTDVILDNMVTFFAAGHDTTSNALSFSLLELCRHPEIMSKLTEEVDTHIGKKSFISYEDVCSLKYFECVFKETLRLYPVAPATIRALPADTVHGDVFIPAGSEVVCSAYSSSRHPDFIENPLDFSPQRHDSQANGRISQVSYFPFSLGARSCIGQNFAMIEMKVVLAKLLQHFSFTLDTGQSFAVAEALMLHPARGVHALLTDR